MDHRRQGSGAEMAHAGRRRRTAMSPLDTLNSCLGAMGANKLRSGLTLLGIIVGVAAVVCMVSVGLGAQAEVAEKIRTLGANLLLVKPAATTQGVARGEAGSGHKLGEEDAAALLQEVAEIVVAAPLVSRATQLIAGNRNWATLVAGTDNAYLTAREWRIGEGRAFTASEIDSAAKVAIIGTDIARELFPGTAATGSTLRIGEMLRSRHHLRPEAADDFTIENPADVLIARQAAMKTLAYLLLSVASVALIVGGISIMNIMLVSVTERTREIGLRMAVGARRGDIRRQFLIEALILALVGGLAGALFGTVAAMAIAWEAGWPVLISPGAILLACGFASLVG